MRLAWRSWEVLEEPDKAGLAQLKHWQRALRVAQEQPKMSSADEDFYFPRPEYVLTLRRELYGTNMLNSNHERQMTPYESLMWNDWLPRIRSALKYVCQLSELWILLTCLAVIHGM